MPPCLWERFCGLLSGRLRNKSTLLLVCNVCKRGHPADTVTPALWRLQFKLGVPSGEYSRDWRVTYAEQHNQASGEGSTIKLKRQT